MPWYNIIKKDIDDGVLRRMLLADAAKNNNNGDYTGVKYYLETP